MAEPGAGQGTGRGVLKGAGQGTEHGVERDRGAGAYVDRHPLASALDEGIPGPGLVALLDPLEPGACDDVTLLEAVAGWERVMAWAAARQAGLVAEMCLRARSGRVEFTAAEVAARLAVTRRAAEVKVDLALGLAAHPQVADALLRGTLDARKAGVLIADTEHLPRADAAAVIAGVLDDAPDLTAPALRTAIRRVECELDAAAAAQRAALARRDRCVRFEPAPDGMGWIHAFLSAPDAVAVMTAVEGLAGPSAPGDARTADQRRADALAGLAYEVLDSGASPGGTAMTVRGRRRPHLRIVVSAETLAARTGEPATTADRARGVGAAGGAGSEAAVARPAPAATGVVELEGYGPLPYDTVAHLVEVAERTVVVEPAMAAEPVVVAEPGVIGDRGTVSIAPAGPVGYRPGAALARAVMERDRTCRFPGCRVAAWRCDIDHVVPFDDTRPADHQTVADNLQCLCRYHHRLKTAGRWRVARDPVEGTTVWTAPTGHQYLRLPEPIDPDPAPGPAPPLRWSWPVALAPPDRPAA